MERIREYFINLSGLAICIGWSLGWPITFAYLIIQDARQSHGLIAWLFLIILDSVIALSWPIYWLIFHWV